MADSETKEQEIHFAKCLFSDLMSRHPGLNMNKKFSRNTDRTFFLSDDIGKSIMYTWHVTRYSIESKLRNDFPRFAKNEVLFKRYLQDISRTVSNTTTCDFTKILEFSALLLEVISFLYRRGITRFLNDVPYYWHLMFTSLISKEFYNLGSWETLASLTKKSAEAYDNNICEIHAQYFMEQPLKNSKTKKLINSSESSSGLAIPDLSSSAITTESSETTDKRNSSSVVVSKETTPAASESLSCDISEMSEENKKCEIYSTSGLSKSTKHGVVEVSYMGTKSKTHQSSEIASLKAKVGIKTVKSARKSSEFFSSTSTPDISPLNKKTPGATGVKPKQPLKSPSQGAAKPFPLTSPSPSKNIPGQKTKHITPMTAASSQVKIFTKNDAIQKHIERMAQLRQQKQTTFRKPSAWPPKLASESIPFRQPPKTKEKELTEPSKKKSIKKPESESIPARCANRLPKLSPEKVKKN